MIREAPLNLNLLELPNNISDNMVQLTTFILVLYMFLGWTNISANEIIYHFEIILKLHSFKFLEVLV